MKKYIPRHCEQTILELKEQFPVILVTGARQTGKTTVLKNITNALNVKYLTFDDPLLEFSAKADTKSFANSHTPPYFFDEIQYVPELFRYLKLIIDDNRENGMYFLTGSSQFQLSNLSSETLAGRVGIINLNPLSKREIDGCKFTKPFIPNENYISEREKYLTNKSNKNIWDYIFTGGYPEVINQNTSHYNFYSNYLRTYIEKDIKKITSIQDELQFLKFLTAVAARTGRLLNYSEISKDIGITQAVCKKWISLLVSSGIIYLLQPYFSNVEKRMVKTPKLYFLDTGLAAFLTRWSSKETLESGASAGEFFETFVISEIVKSFTNNGIDPPLYFYRDKDKIEIDLMILENNTIYPIEIKKTASPKKSDCKNFFITSRIKNMDVSKNIVISNCDDTLYLDKNTIALSVDYI